MLDPVGVVMFEDPVGVPEKEAESPGGVVELVGPEKTDVDPEFVGPDLGGPLIEGAGGVLAIDCVEVVEEVELLRGELEAGAVELMEITGEPEETAVPKVKLEVGRVD